MTTWNFFWVYAATVLDPQEHTVALDGHQQVWDVQDGIQKLVRAGWAGTPVDLAKLANADVSLGDLIE